MYVYIDALAVAIVAYIQVSVNSKALKIQTFRTTGLEDDCLDCSLQYMKK